MTDEQGYGATRDSHDPETEHERPDPDEQEEAAGEPPPPAGPGYGRRHGAKPKNEEGQRNEH